MWPLNLGDPLAADCVATIVLHALLVPQLVVTGGGFLVGYLWRWARE